MHVFIYKDKCEYIHECVFVDVYFVETEKFKVCVSNSWGCLSLGNYLV